MKHDIYISEENGCELSGGEAEYIKKCVETALSAEDVTVGCEINILLTDDEGIREINRSMREIDKATDVLSFPMFDLTPGAELSGVLTDPETGLFPLGDIALSIERARAQAAEYGHGENREIGYLVVHSILHLLGYDHTDDGVQKAQMRAREKTIMLMVEGSVI